MKVHYNSSYFSWQKKSGELGAMIDLFKFTPYVKESDSILDFGCGGGYILNELSARKKSGIEINRTAIKEAQKKGIIMYSSIDTIPQQEKFDVIISHHALEHVDNPAEILNKLTHYVKADGISVHVVPINDWRNDKRYDPSDINQHLYTWTPLLLGNLFTQCGYRIDEVRILTHAWLPLSKYYFSFTPKPLYMVLCYLWSFLTRNRQIIIVAHKK